MKTFSRLPWPIRFVLGFCIVAVLIGGAVVAMNKLGYSCASEYCASPSRTPE